MLDVATAEATALQRGLKLVEQIGCNPVVIETDSMELCQAYNGEIEIWSPYSAILVDCFVRAQRIGKISVQHCKREANLLAHNLARYAFDSNSSIFWDCDPPSFIMPYVQNDVSLFDSVSKFLTHSFPYQGT